MFFIGILQTAFEVINVFTVRMCHQQLQTVPKIKSSCQGKLVQNCVRKQTICPKCPSRGQIKLGAVEQTQFEFVVTSRTVFKMGYNEYLLNQVNLQSFKTAVPNPGYVKISTGMLDKISMIFSKKMSYNSVSLGQRCPIRQPLATCGYCSFSLWLF